MRFQSAAIDALLTGSHPKRLLFFVKLQFPTAMILAHTGIGPRTYQGEEYLGVGNMAKIGQVKDNANKSANKLSLSIQHNDHNIFNQVINHNPIGGLCELSLVSLDDNRQIIGGELLFSGEIADYQLEKGDPYLITVTASDWFEVWGKPVFNAKVTDASQQHLHPDDKIFNQVEKLAQGIDDTIPGKRIGGTSHGGGGGRYER